MFVPIFRGVAELDFEIPGVGIEALAVVDERKMNAVDQACVVVVLQDREDEPVDAAEGLFRGRRGGAEREEGAEDRAHVRLGGAASRITAPWVSVMIKSAKRSTLSSSSVLSVA